jgi:cysteine-rich repeat protein
MRRNIGAFGAAWALSLLLAGCPAPRGEACNNGLDDDGDDRPDCLDDECAAACAAVGCGNGVLEAGEGCDDGNLQAGDGCDSLCQGEGPPGCGDGSLGAGEQCDDGNTQGGDGCRSDCTVERCGDGRLDEVEQCDDGNVAGGDGCSAGCTFDEVTLDGLDIVEGCQGVFNPNQLLDYHLTMSAADFEALKADTTNSIYFQASFRCNDGPEQLVGVRRKRSGSIDKPGLKIDFNELVPGGAFFGLKKLSLENGISEGSGTGSSGDVLSEYLAWRLVVLSGAQSSRAAFARVFVNGQLIGAYTNVEQVDKRFLRTRLGDDSGWLFKKSGSSGDGYKTNETLANPFEADLCFLHQSCPAPAAAELEAYLQEHLDVPQMLLFGGLNLLLANTDSPILKENNYYFYDSALLPRFYFPWDLDTVMNTDLTLFTSSVPGGTTRFKDALFPPFEDNLDLLLTGLLAGPLSLATIEAELDRALATGGPALDADPTLAGDSAAEVAGLKSYWTTRHAQLTAELAAH